MNRGLTHIEREKKDLNNIIDVLGSMGRNDDKEFYERALAQLEGADVEVAEF